MCIATASAPAQYITIGLFPAALDFSGGNKRKDDMSAATGGDVHGACKCRHHQPVVLIADVY
jgi:hypothetical protein